MNKNSISFDPVLWYRWMVLDGSQNQFGICTDERNYVPLCGIEAGVFILDLR
jgi:hypothetical protein